MLHNFERWQRTQEAAGLAVAQLALLRQQQQRLDHGQRQEPVCQHGDDDMGGLYARPGRQNHRPPRP